MLRDIDFALLREMPLDLPDGETDKNSRGRVSIIGGSARVPGAVLLSAVAALRAGAGKVQLCVPRSLALSLGMAIPEAGIHGLDETAAGEPAAEGIEEESGIRQADALLVGPGVMDETAGRALSARLLDKVAGPIYVLDAVALTGLWDLGSTLALHRARIVLTPHAGEMARLAGITKDQVIADPLGIARAASRRLNCVVVMKGATTFIALPDGSAFRHAKGVVGLATAGSGDVLAGIIAGLCARGIEPKEACIWGVFAHGRAGQRLTQRVGPLGFLARELLDEIPRVLEEPRG